MAAIDAAAPEPVDVLVGRAGAAVARVARRLLGGSYGRVVNVVAGKGNNGADGRVAGELLGASGVTVRVFEAADVPESLPPADLVDRRGVRDRLPRRLGGATRRRCHRPRRRHPEWCRWARPARRWRGALAGGRDGDVRSPQARLAARRRQAPRRRRHRRRHRSRRVVGASARRRTCSTSPAGGDPVVPTPTSGPRRCASSPAAPG